MIKIKHKHLISLSFFSFYLGTHSSLQPSHFITFANLSIHSLMIVTHFPKLLHDQYLASTTKTNILTIC